MKKLVISQSNKSNSSNENLYLNFQSYFNFANDKEKFDKKKNIVNHYTNLSFNIKNHFKNCNEIYDKILIDLIKEFNRCFKKNYSLKSGHLIFGFWLQRLIRICYDRYQLLNIAFKYHEIDEVKILNTKNFNFASEKSSEIIQLSSDPDWNYAISSALIEYFELHKKIFKYDKLIDKKKKDINLRENFKINFFKELVINSFQFFNLFCTKRSSIVCDTYLPFFLEKLLQIKLDGIPQAWNFNYSISKKFDLNKRKKITLLNSQKLDGKDKDLESFIRLIIPNCIPISLFEECEDILELTKKYPRKPRKIISATKFDSNDLFKFYSANKLEEGTIIISGQHGNGSFLLPESKYIPDYRFSDYYYTWGNKSNKNFLPLFNINIVNKRKIKSSKKKLTIFTTSYGFNQCLYDKQALNYDNVNFIKKLLLSLPKNIKSELILKKHNLYGLDCHKFLDKQYNKLQIEKTSGESFSDMLRMSKLNLYLYNSTGILDCLALNQPVIFYLKKSSNVFSDEFENKLKTFKDANIFFDNSEELKNHIIKVWDNVERWWKNPSIQETIASFNENFNKKFNKKLFNNFCSQIKDLKNNSLNNQIDKTYTLR